MFLRINSCALRRGISEPHRTNRTILLYLSVEGGREERKRGEREEGERKRERE
jgi:hypothetical protein